MPSRRHIAIAGDGLAGLSAAFMLSRLGWKVRISRSSPPPARVIALNQASQFLLRRIWGEEIFARLPLHVLDQRVVRWREATPVALSDPVVVVDLAKLLERLHEIARGRIEHHAELHEEARILSTTPDTPERAADFFREGRRTAVQAKVTLGLDTDSRTFLVEASELGWVALMPSGGRDAILMGVSADGIALEALLGTMNATQKAVDRVLFVSPGTGAAAHLHRCAAHRGRFVIGDAAMRFDPISGDGVAGALRMAHLAALAVDGGENPGLETFYGWRLARAMKAHLGALAILYREAPFARRWSAERTAIDIMLAAIAPIAERPAPDLAVSELGFQRA